jgi:hypothetical protein
MDRSAKCRLTLSDCSYLGFALPGADDVPDSLAEKRPCERRDVRYRSDSRIGLVLSDNRKALLASVIPNDRHRTAELDASDAGIGRKQLRARAPGAPVAKIAPDAGQGSAVARSLRQAMAPARIIQRRFD